MSKVSVLVVAAGEGRRFGGNKPFVPLKGRPLIEHCLEKFERSAAVTEIVLVLSAPETGLEMRCRFRKIVSVVKGGDRRQDSVLNGFLELRAEEKDIVLVHDGARPLVDAGLIERVVLKAAEFGTAVPAIPVEDTLKEVRDGIIVRTHDRTGLFRVQTPQGFQYGILKRALKSAAESGRKGTDEAFLAEALGEHVAVVAGDPGNIKVTVPEDLRIAEALLED